MKMKLPSLARIAIGAAITGMGIAVAAACSDQGALTPNAPVVASRMAAASVANNGFRLVLLRPVLARDAHGDARTAYATKVVYLRPVMAGEALPKPH